MRKEQPLELALQRLYRCGKHTLTYEQYATPTTLQTFCGGMWSNPHAPKELPLGGIDDI